MQIRIAILALTFIGLLSTGSSAHAARPAATAPQVSAAPTAPVFSPDTRWILAVLIIVGGLFIAAAVIGPLYCMSLPEALPVTYSHDEPPGASHHHGPSGTVDFSIED